MSTVVASYHMYHSFNHVVYCQSPFKSKVNWLTNVMHACMSGLGTHALNIMPFAREIVTINGQPQDLLRLGECYYNFFIRLFKANKGSTLATSSHPSQCSFDGLADMIENMLQEALVRDGFQCAVTKTYDWKSILNNKELEMKVMHEAGWTGSTHCAHIFLEFTNVNITVRYATSVWAVLDQFGYSALWEELNGSNVWFTDTTRLAVFRLGLKVVENMKAILEV
ncbi:hypothetical protein EDD16DRAFT_1515257 [Pisolithus croceorrhizus]|nr:hypothetical protein EV401DRAFT_2162456 [Pisolithus croceorrhizus]KAI6131097.1 hypothetical protein EDD16DRAFT_1515257 [Pisolithus croceorrhizus]